MFGKKPLGYARIDTPGERRLFWVFLVLPILSTLVGSPVGGLWRWLGFLTAAVLFAIVLTHLISTGFRLAGRAARSGVKRAR